MDAQTSNQIGAGNSTTSFHHTFAPQSAILQITLSHVWDYDDQPVPISHASGSFFSVKFEPGGSSNFDQRDFTCCFGGNGLTEVEGMVLAHNCWTVAIVNRFVWPGVE
jgi:hypothetical protein